MVVATIVSTSVMKINESSFIDVYTNQMNLLLDQITTNYYDLNQSVVDTLDICNRSNVCMSYLTDDGDLTTTQQSAITYELQKQFKDTNILSNNTPGTLILVGFNGRTYMNVQSIKTISAQEIIDSDVVQDALKTPDEVTYHYLNTRFVTNGKSEGSVVAIKVLNNSTTKKPYGVAIELINQSDFQYYFNTVDRKTTEVYIIHKNGTFISGNDENFIGKKNQALAKKFMNGKQNSVFAYNDHGTKTAMIRKMNFLDSYIVVSMDNSAFISSITQYTLILIIIIILIVLIACTVTFFLVRRTMKPIRELSNKMPSIISGDFSNKIEIEGSGEIKELSEAYNYMLDGLNNYVNQLMKLEEEKRMSEIHALQMQINPHFMYNTLTSFKFMIWQKDTDTLIQAIDAFIQLLRNTLGNTDEIVSVKQEIENLKNYSFIQHIRFGNNINVKYSISDTCLDYLIPKMILQPFVENSFIHAFDGMEKGAIEVFGRDKNDMLIFEIIDNGVGLPEDMEPKNVKGKKFSGIGISNVNERIQLLYGNNYGVSVSSTKGRGTIIRINLPIIKEEAQN